MSEMSGTAASNCWRYSLLGQDNRCATNRGFFKSTTCHALNTVHDFDSANKF
jgi:hypothetical protein